MKWILYIIFFMQKPQWISWLLIPLYGAAVIALALILVVGYYSINFLIFLWYLDFHNFMGPDWFLHKVDLILRTIDDGQPEYFEEPPSFYE